MIDKLILQKYHNIIMTMKKKANAKRRHPLAHSYNTMMQRCYNENNPQYADYGGRGIIVCKRWMTGQSNAQGFWNFVRDMGEKPTGHSLERINNNKNYTPKNCRWATPKEQQRNRRNNIFITYKGKTQCVKDWANEFGINNATLARRYKLGLPLDVVMSKDNFRGQRF